MCYTYSLSKATMSSNNDDDDDKDNHDHDMVMPGFRFHPTEEELIEFYLRRKVEGKRVNVELITFLDLYRYDPWELPGFCLIGRLFENSRIQIWLLGLLLLPNCCMYLIVAAIGGWAINRAIDHGFIIGIGLPPALVGCLLPHCSQEPK